MQGDQATDVGWLAFQYVNDEMTADEAAAFEQRLADDQPAREAVAQAVLLTEALSCSPLESAPTPATLQGASSRRPWWAAAAWAACGAAACLAVMLGARSWQADEIQPPLAHSRNLLTNEELALAWANSQIALLFQDQLLSGIEPSDLAAGWEDELGLAGSEPSRTSGDLEPNVSVPAWMLEAVHGVQQTDVPLSAPEET
jgi:hypothetical protein